MVNIVRNRPQHSKAARNGDDRGFILVMVGLLIIPIVAFAALAIDVSSWYSRATELQRAADSAALSGVVWLPQVSVAKTNSDENLRLNGLADGVDDIAVTQQPVSTDAQEGLAYKVCVTDNSVTQFFGGVIGSPTTLTRCSTAKFNLPLSMGSSGNSFGGLGSDIFDQIPGHPAIPEYGPAPTPPDDNYSIRPDNYATATVSGLTGKESYFNGGYYGCKAIETPPNRGYYWSASGSRSSARSSSNNLETQSNYVERRRDSRRDPYYYLLPIDLPDCIWSAPAQDAQADQYLIRPDQSPGYWASVEAPGTDAVQGDLISPVCYGIPGTVSGSGVTCANNSRGTNNPRHPAQANENGYFYNLSIGASNPKVMVQVFDAAMQSGSIAADTEWTSSDWTTNFALYSPDGTPYDPTDNNVVADCDGGSGNVDDSGSWSLDRGAESSFRGTWRTLCTLTSPDITQDDDSYILRVWSTGGGNGANNYALRAVASTDTAVDTYNYPTNALAFAQQPTLSAWTRMSINVNQTPTLGTTKATFFFAKITNKYAGQRVNMTLYDSAEGSQAVTINSGDGIQQGCVYESHPLATRSNGQPLSGTSVSSGGGNPIGDGTPNPQTIPPTSDCTIPTSGSTYNGQALTITVPIPNDYTCDATLRPPTVDDVGFNGNGCWWSVTYEGDGRTVTDNTTWEVNVGGNPVRLVSND